MTVAPPWPRMSPRISAVTPACFKQAVAKSLSKAESLASSLKASVGENLGGSCFHAAQCSLHRVFGVHCDSSWFDGTGPLLKFGVSDSAVFNDALLREQPRSFVFPGRILGRRHARRRGCGPKSAVHFNAVETGQNLTPSVHTIILRDDYPAAGGSPEPARYAILEMPSMPIARTRSSTERVETPWM